MSHLDRIRTAMIGMQMQQLELISLQFAGMHDESVMIAEFNQEQWGIVPPASPLNEDGEALLGISRKLDEIVLTIQGLQCFNSMQTKGN